jgi:ADP-heptose:LPS heptosyltransferase
VDPAAADWQPEIFLTDAERAWAEQRWAEGKGQKRLLVNLSASEKKRRWPDGKFVSTLLAARAAAPGLRMILIGLPSEWESVREVAAAVDATPVPTPQLRDAFALVGTAHLVFTPDTSISHAASAFGKPSLVLLKREHAPYAPYNTPGEIVAWSQDEIQQLPHETVSDALLRLISRYAG